MKRLTAIAAFTAALGIAAVALGVDTVRLTKGTALGRVTKMSPTEVEVEGAGGVSKTIPVNEITAIYWGDDEPSALKNTARERITNGDYQNALAALEKINVDQVNRAEVKQEIEFFKAYCMSQLALGGQGDIVDAGRQMANFVNVHKGNYHWLQANEIVGQLLVANGSYKPAADYFSRVAQAPWPDYKMRAGVAIGRALLAQNKTDEALKQFEDVLAMKDDSELGQAQKMAATLGKARCMAAGAQRDEAVKAVQSIIAKLDPENRDLLALAYNTLGTAERAAGHPKEALMAFLHVDLIYNTVPDSHAEALYNLAELWKADNKPEREARCRQLLEQRYRNSPWNKKAS